MLLLAAALLLCQDPAQVRKLARAGDKEAQWQAVQLAAQGKLKGISRQQAEQWRRQAAERGVAQARYELGLALLDATAAEDEPRRFEGLAWLALAAEQKLPIALKRWEMVVEQLGAKNWKWSNKRRSRSSSLQFNPKNCSSMKVGCGFCVKFLIVIVIRVGISPPP